MQPSSGLGIRYFVSSPDAVPWLMRYHPISPELGSGRPRTYSNPKLHNPSFHKSIIKDMKKAIKRRTRFQKVQGLFDIGIVLLKLPCKVRYTRIRPEGHAGRNAGLGLTPELVFKTWVTSEGYTS